MAVLLVIPRAWQMIKLVLPNTVLTKTREHTVSYGVATSHTLCHGIITFYFIHSLWDKFQFSQCC